MRRPFTSMLAELPIRMWRFIAKQPRELIVRAHRGEGAGCGVVPQREPAI